MNPSRFAFRILNIFTLVCTDYCTPMKEPYTGPEIYKYEENGNFTGTRQTGTDGFREFLFHIRYDRRERPVPVNENGTNEIGPTLVGVSIFVGSIRSVSEVTMDYSLELFYREYWQDARLVWNLGNESELSLHESYGDFLWKPDTFFPNAIRSQNPKEKSITHRSLVRLMPGGKILFSRRISVTAECPMDLTMFPFDSQICKLGLESYGYPNTEIQYAWKGEHPVQVGNIRLPDFTLTQLVTVSKNAVYETGTYSRLYACFIFARSAGFCFMQLIVPSTAVVITSWVSLWLENETSFQDMIAIILTITFLLFSYNTVMPRVSYIKAMDIYLGACFFFVFIALIRLAIVKYMNLKLKIDRDASLNTIKLASQSREPLASSCNGDVMVEELNSLKNQSNSTNMRRWKCMQAFHAIFQIFIPLSFICFCFFFFVVYPRIFVDSSLIEC